MTDLPELDATHEFRVERELNAPPEEVWRVWTEPRHIENWWGPEGFGARVEEVSFRKGGTWAVTMLGPDGDEYPGRGTILEVETGRRIVSTDEFAEGFELEGFELPEGVTMTVDFIPLEGGKRTRLVVTVRHPDLKQKVAHEEMGAIEGWRSMLGELAKYVEP